MIAGILNAHNWLVSSGCVLAYLICGYIIAMGWRAIWRNRHDHDHDYWPK